jgi:hypothetical protein
MTYQFLASVAAQIIIFSRKIFVVIFIASQIRRSGFDSRHYQKKKVVCLERSPLSLVSTTEELLGRKSSGSDLENREYCRRDPSR